MEISEKEFAVINAIHNNLLLDQRTIAVKAGISLGLTNLLIRRLIIKGCVKAKQLNQKKIQYLLTPKGFSEKATKSYLYTQKTIGLIKSIKHRLNELIKEKHNKGVNSFIIVGNNEELSDIIQIVIRNIPELSEGCTYDRPDNTSQALHLKYIDPESKKEESVDLIEYLSNTGMFYQ